MRRAKPALRRILALDRPALLGLARPARLLALVVTLVRLGALALMVLPVLRVQPVQRARLARPVRPVRRVRRLHSVRRDPLVPLAILVLPVLGSSDVQGPLVRLARRVCKARRVLSVRCATRHSLRQRLILMLTERSGQLVQELVYCVSLLAKPEL